MLDVVRLTKLYQGRAVVDEVSFSIAPGDILGYLGPNGSGKSTTVKMLVGLVEPTRGRLHYCGRDIRADMVAFQRTLGYVPEEPLIYPYLTGCEYLQLAGRLRSLPERLLNEKIKAMLDLFSLFEHRYSPMSSYSKGMKQKILIAAALLHDPEVILFDEPLSGLDVTSAMIFKHLIHDLARAGKVILYSSHMLEVVERVCTRVLILRRGKVVAHDSVEHLRQLLESPTLENAFAQLVVQEDTEKTAAEMVAVIRG